MGTTTKFRFVCKTMWELLQKSDSKKDNYKMING
ncbi:hypothetical protein LEP1GSC111_1382, partial [Leptospira interrogans str. UT126]